VVVAATVEAAHEPVGLGERPVWAPEVAEAVALGVADGGGRQVMIKENHMRSNTFTFLTSLVAAQMFALVCVFVALVHATPQSSQRATTGSQPVQTSFGTPKLAAEALIQAAATYDVPVRTGW
jgi:hypothetical protein